MAVIRPDDLVIVDAEIIFNFVLYTKLEIDLQHINRGKKFTRESDYTATDVVELVTEFLNGDTFAPESMVEYDTERCDYFSVEKFFKGNKFKLIFCHCTDRNQTLGIMTMYRVRNLK